MVSSPWFIIPAITCAASAGLLAWAMRGRRVGDHPHCRRCGFDLFGKPESSTACAECGADLSRRRAVRVGRRETRRPTFALSLPVLLGSIGWLGVVGWGHARGVDWNRHKPAWLLVREAERGNAAARDAALAELTRRVAEGTLPPEREDALVDRALTHQADWKQPWVSGWGDFVERLHQSGRLPRDRWERYQLQAMTFTLEPRDPTFRRDGSVSFHVAHGPRRATSPPGASYRVGLYPLSGMTLAGQPVPVKVSSCRADPLPVARPACAKVQPEVAVVEPVVDPQWLAGLANGSHAARLSFTVRPVRFDGERMSWVTDPGGPAHQVELEAEWTLADDAERRGGTEREGEVMRGGRLP